jgi:hypothetical protein
MLYEERLSSNSTEALFVTLTFVFLGLFVWRAMVVGFRGWADVAFSTRSPEAAKSLIEQTLPKGDDA